mmetsp:Transcript_2359/g.4982  ORF Transcript_2359/g.4982 Transcript_2359/m.4982 type:complete len:85 (-) Transcript_2359:445-699(-)
MLTYPAYSTSDPAVVLLADWEPPLLWDVERQKPLPRVGTLPSGIVVECIAAADFVVVAEMVAALLLDAAVRKLFVSGVGIAGDE